MRFGSVNNHHFFITVFFMVNDDRLQLVQYSDPGRRDAQKTIPTGVELSLRDMENLLKDGPVYVDMREADMLPPPLTNSPRQLGCQTAAYVPIIQRGQLRGLVLIGAREGQKFNEEVVGAFASAIRLTVNSLKRGETPTEPINDRRSAEVRAINTLSSNVTNAEDLHSFYTLIHDQVRSVIGDYGFVIAIYDQRTNSIRIPLSLRRWHFLLCRYISPGRRPHLHSDPHT